MTTKTFEVPNIGCAGCVQAIKNELAELPGLVKIEGEVKTRMVRVEFDEPTSWEMIVSRLKEIDYPPATA